MNPQTHPDSTLLRILRFPLTQIVLLYAALQYAHLAGILFMQAFGKGPVLPLVVGVLIVANLLFVYVGYAHFVERRPVVELALPGMARELGIGLVLGFGLYTTCVLIAMALGLYRIEGLDSWRNLIPSGAALSVPMFEELLFRGVVFRLLQNAFGTWLGLLLSSVVFGLAHLTNEGESLAGIAAIAFVFGPLLTAPFIITGRLWMGIGLHAAWNYTMGKVFSGAVSGNSTGEGLFKTTFQGPDLLTGGSAGMEASLIAIGVAVVATGVMLAAAKRRGKIVPPPWTRGPGR